MVTSNLKKRLFFHYDMNLVTLGDVVWAVFWKQPSNLLCPVTGLCTFLHFKFHCDIKKQQMKIKRPFVYKCLLFSNILHDRFTDASGWWELGLSKQNVQVANWGVFERSRLPCIENCDANGGAVIWIIHLINLLKKLLFSFTSTRFTISMVGRSLAVQPDEDGF